MGDILLTVAQLAALVTLRNLDGYVSAPAYSYSQAMKSSPELPDTVAFFFAPK